MSGNGYSYKGHGTNNQVWPHTTPSPNLLPPTPPPNPNRTNPPPLPAGQPLLRPGLRLQRLQLQHVPLLQHVRPGPAPPLSIETNTDKRSSDGSYYYSNPNGSTYYNNGAGGSTYTAPSGGNSQSSGSGSGSSGSAKK